MNDLEVTEKEFFDEIDNRFKEMIGPVNFEIGKKIDFNNFKFFRTYEFYSNKKLYSAKYYDKNTYDYLNITFVIDNNEIQNYRCECRNFIKYNTCPHISAFYHYKKKEMFIKPPTKKELSKEILSLFNSNNSKKDIKEEMQLDIELDLYDPISFKIHVGTKKTYVLNSERKLLDFIDSYENSEITLGKQFTYDPNKHYFNENNKKIFEFLCSSINRYERYESNLSLTERELLSLLELLKNKPFTITNVGKIFKINYGLPKNLILDKINDNYSLKFNDFDNIKFVSNISAKYLVYKNELYILDKNEDLFMRSYLLNNIDEIVFDNTELNNFKTGLLKKLNNNITISENINDIIIDTKPNIKLYFDLYRDKIICDMKLVYRNVEINYFDNVESIIRDEETELNCLNKLKEYNFITNKNKFELDDIDDIGLFLEEGLDSLNNEYEIFTSKKIDNIKINKKINFNSTFSIGKDGILSYNFETSDINLDELDNVFANIRKKKKYYKLKNGNIINLNDNNLNDVSNLLDDLNIRNIDESITIPKYKAFYIDSLKNSKYKNIKTDNSFNNFINNFKKYKDLNLNFDNDNILRDYQKDGVKWLYTLYKCDLGGILADEMGLGKSIQTIYFIKEILKEKKDAKILIVCPTSLVYNWKKEFDKFGSELKYITVAENKEKRKEIINNFDKYNIFITSYGLIRNDNDEYENKNFELCIIDEAQAIKNYQAELTKEVKKIKAHTKIALTGTPIENSIFELWSIFDFIMPGYLNTIVKFRETYSVKDFEKESLEKLDKLNYQIKPFILRRKKNDVIKDLPDKIEDNIYLDLPDKQKKLYLKVLKESEKEIDELIRTEGYNKASFKILQLLLKLRQICINPNIAYQNYNGEAIKIEKLIELVNELKENHKILIFSSFKTVIDSVKEEFNKHNITSYTIDGSVKSKDRMNLVDKFNNDDTNCFLITLKSGGTGLNLTSADVVIHLDIWWNPQAENQATDRAHRIGQTKNVNVIKLITKGTIEERIIELQNKKKLLSDNIIEGKNTNTISSISEEEMKELLAFTNE